MRRFGRHRQPRFRRLRWLLVLGLVAVVCWAAGLVWFARSLPREVPPASLRTDGASRFAQGNRFGVFPAASFGWVATEEPFLTVYKTYLDKVR